MLLTYSGNRYSLVLASDMQDLLRKETFCLQEGACEDIF